MAPQSKDVRITPFATLLVHEGRILLTNRMACMVIVATIGAAAWLGLSGALERPFADDVCYVLYWRDDAWIDALRDAAPAPGDPLHSKIVVAPASRFDRNGLIVYPAGAHSIQIRPLPDGANGEPAWLVWYWHSGSDPAVLWPYARWFWQVTREHFNDDARWQERVSSLQPWADSPVGESVGHWKTWFTPARLRGLLTWMALFFCTCHLPTLSLAQDRERQTIFSVALTSAGWVGAARARRSFYFLLGVTVAVLVGALTGPASALSPAFWTAIAVGAAAYLGLAFLMGSLCGSIASASVAVLAYMLVASAAFLLAEALGETPGFEFARGMSLERDLFVLIEGAGIPAAGWAETLGLPIVGVLFWSAGAWAYRRLVHV
jgi:hypothetical protein